jgi:peptidoglycan-N-acetylglucosamine deacetylase
MTQWPHSARAAVSLSFDDARPSQVACGLAALDAHNLKATFYVTINAMKQHLDAWKRAAATGHEIGNHTLTHPCSGNYEFARNNALEDYTLDRMQSDIQAADDEIQKLLGIRATTFAYPCGQKFVGRGEHLQSYVPLVAKRFKIGRGFNDTTANDPAFFDTAQTLGVDMDMKTFADLKPLFDLALQQQSWLVLVGHDIGPDPLRQTTLLKTIDDIARSCAESGIWLDTVDAVASHILTARGASC